MPKKGTATCGCVNSMNRTAKLVGIVKNVIVPRQGDNVRGFIATNAGETIFFNFGDLRTHLPPEKALEKIVSFDVVPQTAHQMRRAVNIDLLSEVAG